MPKRKPDDVSDLAPWIEWERVVARVRSAKSPEQAMDLMKRHFRMAIDMRTARIREEYCLEKAVNQAMKERQQRLQAMAKAMAGEGEEWGKFYVEVSRLDAALMARRKFEI